MQKNRVIGWFSVTFLLGLIFVVMEVTEFSHLIRSGDSFKRSAFLSSYFTLVGTHGLHVTVGLIGMLILIIRIYTKGLTKASVRRLTLLSLFWHFLDIIWIFIFTIVYMLGFS
jgi:cytochrome o ubiquinol oxidase subunit 3